MGKDFDIKRNHKIVLDVFKELQRICREYNLKYYAISGTTLGAIFWNGIIPWDDDIDIALPAEDYKKFVSLCKKGKLLKNYSFIEYVWFGGKLFDNQTMFTNVYYLDKPEKFTGVSIDVVPLINLPDNDQERQKFIDELKQFHEAGILFDRYGISNEIYNKKSLEEKRKYFLNSYKFGETKYVMDFSDYRYVLRAKGFEEPVIMDFGDTTIPVSSNYDEDLTTQYGNYSKYPPKETRESLHRQLSLIDLDKSWKKYAKEFEKIPESVKKIIAIKHFYEGYCEKSLSYQNDVINSLKKENEIVNSKNRQKSNRLSRRIKNVVKKWLKR